MPLTGLDLCTLFGRLTLGAGGAREARGAKDAFGASLTFGASGALRMVKVLETRGAEGARGALGAGRKAKTW